LLTAGASHGFPPSRVLRPWPWSGFRPTPSLALRSCRNDLRHSPAPQSLDRPLLGLYRLRHLRTASPKATLLGFPHRLGPTHSDATPPGLSFSPRAGSHITAASPTVFRWWQRPTGVARIGLGADVQRLTATEFRVRLFSLLPPMVAPPAGKPGKDTSVSLSPRLHRLAPGPPPLLTAR
jgi:hypothetical protein